MSDGPHLILVAFWLDEPDTDAVAEAVRCSDFPPPEGYPRGAVVSFRREVAQSPAFQRDLGRLDLAELNDWPSGEQERMKAAG